MKDSSGTDWKVLVISLVGAVLIIELVVGLALLFAGGKNQTGAQVTAPTTAMTTLPGGGTSSGGSHPAGAASTSSGSTPPAGSHTTPGTSPAASSTPTAVVMPIWLTTLSASSSDSATRDSATFNIASGGRIIARVTVSPIGPGDHYLKVDFNPEGEPDSSGHECLSIYDPIANHEYVLAEYVAGGYYLHATAVNCTYTIVLEQQF